LKTFDLKVPRHRTPPTQPPGKPVGVSSSRQATAQGTSRNDGYASQDVDWYFFWNGFAPAVKILKISKKFYFFPTAPNLSFPISTHKRFLSLTRGHAKSPPLNPAPSPTPPRHPRQSAGWQPAQIPNPSPLEYAF